jgi:hypothetical protein
MRGNYVKHLIAFIACLALAGGIAGAQTPPAMAPSGPPLAPSAIVAAASTYDKQTIVVTGTVKGVSTRQGPRGTVTMFQLCDAQCVNVVEFGDQTATIAEGSTQTLTGRFRAQASFGQQTETNLLLVGGRGGHRPQN